VLTVREVGLVTLFSWNIENLPRFLAPAAGTPPLREIVTAWGAPAIVCLQETRIRPRDTELVRAMERALPGYACHHALCDDPRNVTYRGGRAYGVVTYVKRRFATSRGRTLPWDREGRVVVVELPKKKLAVVNLYAVNGTAKPYFDHELGRVRGDRHAFKRRMNLAILREAEALAARGFALVLVGDWNISRTAADTHPRLRTEEPHARARRELNEKIIPALDVVDAFRALHPTERKYTWFNKWSRRLDAARVDYALVSRSLAVEAADIDEARAHRFGSDHAPLWLTLRL
jgi:exodeoxyribonuclease III